MTYIVIFSYNKQVKPSKTDESHEGVLNDRIDAEAVLLLDIYSL